MSAMVLTTQPLATQTFSDDLWKANQDVYDAILEHPFLIGMQDGSLPPDIFAFYVVQDTRYLQAFADALTTAAAKAPDRAWAKQLTADAQDSLEEERRLHKEIFARLGISEAEATKIDSTPDAFAYANFLIVTAERRPFAEAIAALLPCYWIYWEVGKTLQAKGSPNPLYQAWIGTYIAPGYAAAVTAVIQMVNSVAATAGARTRERMHEHFRRSSDYEWLFWDAAYQRQSWPSE
ncbi:MAG: thiaminase II [Gemmatimonadetes bacterium]|nr:thiaminase II [Gemmatimonadota bacterium]